jgi:hypothetical protein
MCDIKTKGDNRTLEMGGVTAIASILTSCPTSRFLKSDAFKRELRGADPRRIHEFGGNLEQLISLLQPPHCLRPMSEKARGLLRVADADASLI